MHKLGVRRVYFFGVILTGVCALVFGTLDYIEDKVTFLVGFSKENFSSISYFRNLIFLSDSIISDSNFGRCS
jgi:hypothetical protein